MLEQKSIRASSRKHSSLENSVERTREDIQFVFDSYLDRDVNDSALLNLRYDTEEVIRRFMLEVRPDLADKVLSCIQVTVYNPYHVDVKTTGEVYDVLVKYGLIVGGS